MCFIDLCDCFGVEWESLDLRVREVLRWCKQNEVGHSSSEDQNAQKKGAGDMTQQFRVLPAFAENPASVSSNHVGWFQGIQHLLLASSGTHSKSMYS